MTAAAPSAAMAVSGPGLSMLLVATSVVLIAHAAVLAWAVLFIADGWRGDLAVQRWRAPFLWALIAGLPTLTIAVLCAFVFLTFGETR